MNLVRALFLGVALVTTSAGCNLLQQPESRVRAGELFEVAHDKYDPYFREVHALQVQVAAWDQQKDASRRPLVDALKLDPDVADVTLVQSTHERLLGIARDAGNLRLEVTEGRGRVVAQNASKVDESGRTVFGAIESCVKNEMDRAKVLREVPAKADGLIKQGRALEPQVKDDLSRRGQRIPKLVQDELQASYEVLADISKSSRLRAREAEDFVADLRRAVDSDVADSAARPGSTKASPKERDKDRDKEREKDREKERDKPRAKPPSEDRPAPKPVAEAPKPVESPKPKSPEPKEAPKEAKPPPKEDFNP